MTQEPLVLAIDTVLGGTSVALGRGTEVAAVKTGVKESEQAEQLVPMIAALMRESDINPVQVDGLLVATGPGGFTGVRVGISAARALAFACNKPLAGVSCLENLAAAAARANPAAKGRRLALRASGRGEIIYQQFAANQIFAGAGQPIERDSIQTAAARFGFDPAVLSESGASCVFWPENQMLWRPEAGHAGASDLIAIAALLPESRWRDAVVPVYPRPPDARPRGAA